MVKLFVCCLVDSEWQAINIVERLRAAGFSSTEISVLFPGRSETPGDGSTASATDLGACPEPVEGPATASGGIAASVFDRSLGWLTGFVQLGSCVGAGPIMKALGRWNWPKVDLDGISAPLRTFGISGTRAQYYAERLASGELFIAVHAEQVERANRAEQIFCRLGAQDIGHSGSVTFSSPEWPGARGSLS